MSVRGVSRSCAPIKSRSNSLKMAKAIRYKIFRPSIRYISRIRTEMWIGKNSLKSVMNHLLAYINGVNPISLQWWKSLGMYFLNRLRKT